MIDTGHGGDDPGTIGKMGTKEPVMHDIKNKLKRACESILPALIETTTEMIARFDPEFQIKIKNNIVLAGGGSLIRGLCEYLQDALKEYGLKSSTSVPVKPAPAEKAAVTPKELQKPTGETPESKSAAPAKPSAMPSVSSAAPAVPKTSPKPEPKSTGKIIYHVQLGAFKNTNNAEALAKDYKAKGYETFIQKSAGKDKETLYRVLIGKFENKKEAAKLAHSIEAKEKTKTVIFKE